MPSKKDYVAAAAIVAGHRQRGVTSVEACRTLEDGFVELFKRDDDFREVLFRTACHAKPKEPKRPTTPPPKSRPPRSRRRA